MTTRIAMQNLLDPAILFFIFGVLAGAVKSNLEIPQPIARFLSLYLLMALGVKGGFALAQSGFTAQVATSLACAILLALVVPALGSQVLKRFLSGYDAAAVAATYGSVSAVTFITAVQHGPQRPGLRRAHGGCHGVDGVARDHHGRAVCQPATPTAGRSH